MKSLVGTIFVALFLLPSPLFAAGRVLNGVVDVWTSGSRMYLQGSLDVRFNTSISGSPYIGANGYAGDTVYFFGRDNEGDYFSCYVTTSNSKYDDFAALKNSVKNGSRIYVYKSTSSNECQGASVGTYSYFID